MKALSVREYRNNLAASFTRASNGDPVLIRRKNEIYVLVKVGRGRPHTYPGAASEDRRGNGRNQGWKLYHT